MGCYIDKDNVAKDACGLLDGRLRKPDTFYIFNHVDIIITYHSGKDTEWGPQFGDQSGRIICKEYTHYKYTRFTFFEL